MPILTINPADNATQNPSKAPVKDYRHPHALIRAMAAFSGSAEDAHRQLRLGCQTPV
jgi:hypothetical protein